MIIYKATNKINGHVYIGKSIYNLYKRKKDHKALSKSKKSNTYFHKAIRKYSFNNFEWEILTETDSESKLNALEKFYIASYRKMGKVYNMTDGGEGASGISPSEETKRKLSEYRKGKTPWNKGLKWSKETRINISNGMGNTNKGWLGKKHSEETKRKMSLKASGPGNPMYGIPSPNIGKHHTKETKRKISEANKNPSEETKLKMSMARKKYYENKKRQSA